MAQNITKSSKDIVKSALEVVPAISVEEALVLQDSQEHVFVDLRDGNEQAKSGVIRGAVASSRGMMEFHIDPESPCPQTRIQSGQNVHFLLCIRWAIGSSRAGRHGNGAFPGRKLSGGASLLGRKPVAN